MFPIFTLKKPSRTLIRRNAKNRTTKPTIAATIWPLAASTAALSPPDRIHLTAPQAKKNSAITTAAINMRVIRAPKILPISSALKRILLNVPFIGIFSWADAMEARDKKPNNADIETNFFIKLKITYLI